ncbi:Dabb family protein [Halalkalibacter kiskunsagensis]|uniref:Dabb family protein n=1 Tax=Halalkalibacter kiskunsagensis TaxID=1548599 RepID=A0ABV6KA41_9BACI
METKRIKHTAFFNLKYPVDSPETERFLQDGKEILSDIPVVNQFEVLRQVSPKSEYDFGFSMEFNSQADYDAYNSHQSHQEFVENRGKVEVVKFQEIDCLTLDQ